MTSPAATAPARSPRALPRPHEEDVLIAFAGGACGLLLWFLDLGSAPVLPGLPGWLNLAALAVMCLAATLRRGWQPWVLYVGIAAQALDTLSGSLLATMVLFTDHLYAAVLYGSARFSRAVLRASVAVTALVSVGLLVAYQRAEMLLLIAACAGVLLVPTTTGEMIRNHREKAEAERLRAEQTALLAELDRKEAVNAERARMARELHDVVANHLSAIAIHSTAALSLRGSDEQGSATHEALGVIRENSVQGLAEMRRLIGLLRNAAGVDEPAAAPSLDGLDALLERARALAGDGRTFTLSDGRPPGERLPAPVELAAYRVVQEAVTNALKHAAPGPVAVALHRDPAPSGALHIRVTSPLEPDGAHGGAPRAPGAGAGLIGMRERAELLHGDLTAGPSTAGGRRVWEVHAVLPALDETAVAPPAAAGEARAQRRTEPREAQP
ncbi:two-component sensor histidine kinase [Streptomyces albus subsp. chlorinus]|uniref:sensor histidine kinase n=1 Tax=Streptomyces albus TaxID=1888 RepID=UPI00157079D5|nr:histidine kinase [Streptomyces albus]NSC23933.1 two-component sensor histidine kinase [Streptomyces albus subsp. chlorinus]